MGENSPTRREGLSPPIHCAERDFPLLFTARPGHPGLLQTELRGEETEGLGVGVPAQEREATGVKGVPLP